MAIPDYADERSFEFFRRGFVGTTHGENGSGYRTDWDSESKTGPTAMIQRPGRPVCAYCGNVGMPLQPYISSHGHYDVTGYTCVCKDAMDEKAWDEEMKALRKRHAQEIEELEDRAPKLNPAVLKGIMQKLSNKLEKADNMYDIQHILLEMKNLGEQYD